MEFIELSADESQHVEALTGLQNALRTHEAPWKLPATPETVAGFLRHGWDLEPAREFGLLDDGLLLVHGAVSTTEWDNLELAWLDLEVHPQARGRGLGLSMLRHVESVAQEMGRTKLGIDAWDGSSGVAFAERQGYAVASRAVNRRQHLDELDLDMVERLHGETAAAASAYELEKITGHTPEHLLGEVAAMAASINDAPLDDLDIEDEVFPPQRVRDYETAVELRGERMYRLLARHRDTGELAGHTVVAVESHRPEVGHQHDTSVVRSHRGHRLGLFLKTGMNLWLAEDEPQLRVIDTWNAESNDHMIKVNEVLGYRWMARGVQLQKKVQAPAGAVA